MDDRSDAKSRPVAVPKGHQAARVFVISVGMCLLLAGLPGASAGYPRPGTTERVSVGPGGAEGHGAPANPGPDHPLDSPSISSNGRYVAFSSGHEDLDRRQQRLPVDIDSRHVFLHDRVTQKTELVSVDSFGNVASNVEEARVSSSSPSVSKDGRFVAFESDADTLGLMSVVGGFTDIYVRDRKSGATELITRSHDGLPADGSSSTPSVSDDGRYVAFTSTASNLMPTPDTNLNPDIYVYDRTLKEMHRVSLLSDGSEAENAGSSCPSISRSGRFVVFRSDAELVPEDSNLWSDVYVHDRKSGKTHLVSVSSAEEGGNFQSDCGGAARVISDDGRYVVFHSGAMNMVPNDRTGLLEFDTFIRDRVEGRTERVSVNSWGEPGETATAGPAASISASGRFVTFENISTNLDQRDTPGMEDWDSFVHDRRTGSTSLVSLTSDGEKAPRCETDHRTTWRPAISADGRWIAFNSCSPGLVSDDTNEGIDTFVRDAGAELGIARARYGGTARVGSSPSRSSCSTGDRCGSGEWRLFSKDAADEGRRASHKLGVDLHSASLVHRPLYRDLFAVIELQDMPPVTPGTPLALYGLKFKVESKSYEVRATSLRGGSFGLFSCAARPRCESIAQLRGGYGTTGMRVVFSLPLEEIGVRTPEALSRVQVYSALGDSLMGPARVLDVLRLR